MVQSRSAMGIAHQAAPHIALVISCLVLPGCSDSIQEPTPGSVQGTVTEIGSGTPVPDAGILLVTANSVSPFSHVTRTDAQGRYLIEDVPAGDYGVFLYHERLTRFDRTAPLVHVGAGAIATFDMRLIEWGFSPAVRYWIRGVVVDAVTKQPLSGALVEPTTFALSGIDIEGLFGGFAIPYWGATDNEGHFSILDNVYSDPGGENVGLEPITVVHEGYEPFTLVGPGEGGMFGPPIPLPKDSVLTVTISLRPFSAVPNGALRGRVLNVVSNAVVPNLLVGLSILAAADPDTFYARGPSLVPLPGKVARTGPDGGFTIGGLAAGTYVVTPAYLEGDGYVAGGGWYSLPVITVAEADTAVDAGDVPVVNAVRPLAPPLGAEITELNPELRWEPFPPGEAYTVLDYELQVGTGFLLDVVADHLPEPRWQGSTFEPGDHVRWSVRARLAVGSPPDTIRLFIFEGIPTFLVSD